MQRTLRRVWPLALLDVKVHSGNQQFALLCANPKALLTDNYFLVWIDHCRSINVCLAARSLLGWVIRLELDSEKMNKCWMCHLKHEAATFIQPPHRWTTLALKENMRRAEGHGCEARTLLWPHVWCLKTQICQKSSWSCRWSRARQSFFLFFRSVFWFNLWQRSHFPTNTDSPDDDLKPDFLLAVLPLEEVEEIVTGGFRPWAEQQWPAGDTVFWVHTFNTKGDINGRKERKGKKNVDDVDLARTVSLDVLLFTCYNPNFYNSTILVHEDPTSIMTNRSSSWRWGSWNCSSRPAESGWPQCFWWGGERVPVWGVSIMVNK